MKSFSEETRFAIDEGYLKELEEMDIPEDAYALILPSGFIPCSLKCPKAWENKLIAYVNPKEYQMILELEEELKKGTSTLPSRLQRILRETPNQKKAMNRKSPSP